MQRQKGWAKKRWIVLSGSAVILASLASALGSDRKVGELPVLLGPRGPVGPDVPLTETEKWQLAGWVAVEGRSAAVLQAACERAIKEKVRAVFLPAGEYVFETTVRVPGGLTLFGEGSKSICRSKGKDTRLFKVEGDLVRFTRLKLQGADTTRNEDNNTYGISVNGRQKARIDHCELLGFSHATDFGSEASGQVDHCTIHHNLRDGLGYGVCILSGAYVLVTDNEFSQNRHFGGTPIELTVEVTHKVGGEPGQEAHGEQPPGPPLMSAGAT
jgi:hypothetical protein